MSDTQRSRQDSPAGDSGNAQGQGGRKWSTVAVVLLGALVLAVALVEAYLFPLGAPGEAGQVTVAEDAGRLVIRSNVRGDRAFIGDEAVGPTGPDPHVLAPGRYRLRVEKPGLTTWEDWVRVEAGETTLVEAELASAPTGEADRATGADESALETRVFTVEDDQEMRIGLVGGEDGDTLEIAPGTYVGPLTVFDRLLIRGMGDDPGDVVIDFAGDYHTLIVDSQAPVFQNLTIRYSGDSTRTAVLTRKKSRPRFENVHFEINDAGIAGLAAMDDSRPVIFDSRFSPTASASGDSNAVIVDDRARPNIYSSRFEGFAKPVIGVVGSGAPVVERNEIVDLRSNAFVVYGGAGGRFAGNLIRASSSRASPCIVAHPGSEAAFIDNRIFDCGASSMEARDGHRSRFEGNTVRTTD